MDGYLFKIVKKVGWIILVVDLLVCIFMVVEASLTKENTGILKIVSTNPQATLFVTQNNHQSKVAGMGSATVRLSPGIYQILAIADNKETSVQTTIVKKQSAVLRLSNFQSFKVPFLEDVNFMGTDGLTDNGLTVAQVDDFKQQIFGFKPAVSFVNIISDSIHSLAPNPANNNPFVLNFQLTIDDTTYSAAIVYGSNLNTVQMSLSNPSTGAQVYKSN